MAGIREHKRYSIAFICVIAMTVAVSAALVGCGLSEMADMQPQEEASIVGDVPEGKVLYFKVITTRAEDGFTRTTESWFDPADGNFLVKETDGRGEVTLTACDGEFYQVYDSYSRDGARLSLSKVMEFNPEAIDARRQWLTRTREWVKELTEQDAASGKTVVCEGREAVLYAGIRDHDGTEEVGGYSYDITVDPATGLPIKIVMYGANGMQFNSTVYLYGVADVPPEGFSIQFPQGCEIETDEVYSSDQPVILSAADLKAAAKHKVYWCGERLDEFVLSECLVSGTGVTNLKYTIPGKPSDWTEAVEVDIYEFDPKLLDEGVRSNIFEQMTNPRVVEGKAGTYTLYDSAFNGMPMLEVVKDSVHILIIEPILGDIELMVYVADTLEEVR
ncbi:MAG: hypothetical protein GX604_05010 [Actinobacteria bacterium]|nr:hypothetical protein [Actinomycetota bacterium]